MTEQCYNLFACGNLPQVSLSKETIFGVFSDRKDILLSHYSPRTKYCISVINYYWTQQKEKQDKLIYMHKNIQHLIYIIYIAVVLKERIHKCAPTDKNIHMVFDEQAVCKLE